MVTSLYVIPSCSYVMLNVMVSFIVGNTFEQGSILRLNIYGEVTSPSVTIGRSGEKFRETSGRHVDNEQKVITAFQHTLQSK